MRAIHLISAIAFVLAGASGVALGAARIGQGQIMHGLANVIVGGLVALHGVQTWREEV